ncbi:hypothetical protein [Pontibacillus yanchengensis]|uniref:Uncharacterized protein n=1 Tax=Pontibacillus yanchengensis Y32 TaxID=1385514 RepID=A0A0A2TWD9_9BACI|nr:hypothetical protein [Pontibacillus yanchengensis]KGP73610.1 hypothetical protein N782_03980 [Pontibacillus yanchengensis Y32]
MIKRIITLSIMVFLVLIWFVSNSIGDSLETDLGEENMKPLTIKSGERKLELEPNVICSNLEDCKDSQTHTLDGKAPAYPTLNNVHSGDEIIVDFKKMNPDEKGLTTIRNGNQLVGHLKNNRIEVIHEGADIVRYKVYAKWKNKQNDLYGILVYMFEANISHKS